MTEKLRILHVFRSPVGGLFRHVTDLAMEQAKRGHAVGLVMDSTTGGARAQAALEDMRPLLTLGCVRIPMSRLPALSDIAAQRHVNQRTRETKAQVVHGHGSKGGLYARLPGIFSQNGPIRCYTPHGGSFHYKPGSMAHRIFMASEKALHRGTDLLLFESAYIRRKFVTHVGEPRCLDAVVLNGISEAEFTPVRPAADAAEFFYIGELRAIKGVDTLLSALAALDGTSRLNISGAGPDEDALRRQAASLGLADRVAFLGAMSAREAFTRGRIMVAPSRAESLPYVLIEAAGAHVPLVTTDVGGVSEIFGPHAHRLIAPDDAAVLRDAMSAMLRKTPDERATEAAALHAHVRDRFVVERMADSALSAYRQALDAKEALFRAGARAALQSHR